MKLFAGLEQIVETDVPLADRTTFGIGGPAKYLISPTSVEQLAEVVVRCRENDIPMHVLGGGSNLLINDAGVKDAVIHPGCRITGKETLIRAGAAVGLTGPCVLENMVLDRDVRLGSGAFRESVLLKGAHLGSSIRVRENCLIEEGCELSFSVDVKHTFLLAHVILGSEINFCDLLMAGGTSRKDHSEVGSGVIHFNFTPYGASGDKATATLAFVQGGADEALVEATLHHTTIS